MTDQAKLTVHEYLSLQPSRKIIIYTCMCTYVYIIAQNSGGENILQIAPFTCTCSCLEIGRFNFVNSKVG